MAMIKTKIQETDDARTKIHLLTLAPNRWPISKLQEYFQVRLKVELIHNIQTLSGCIFVPIYSLYIEMYIYIEIKTRLEFSLQKSLQQSFSIYIQVTSYQAKKAKKLFQEKGTLSFPDSKKGKPLPKYIEAITIKSYEDDEYSREMPGIDHFSFIYTAYVYFLFLLLLVFIRTITHYVYNV